METRATTTGARADHEREHEHLDRPTERGPGLIALSNLGRGGAPNAGAIAQLLAEHPAESEVLVAAVQGQYGNAFTDQVLAQRVPADLPTIARELVTAGASDENHVTNEVFWRRYPALRDRKLTPGTALAQDWLAIRDDVVRDAIAHAVPAPTPVGPAPGVAQVEAEPPTITVPEVEIDHADSEVDVEGLFPDVTVKAGPTPVTTPVTTTTPPPKVRPAADTIKTTKEEAEFLNQLRASTKRMDPTWLKAAQDALGVANASGAMNTETLRAFRREAGAKITVAEVLADTFLADKAPGTHVFKAGATTAVRADRPGDVDARHDAAARAGGAASYQAWQDAWVQVTLLGKTLGQGHPHLARKVQAADAYLRGKYSGKDDAAIRGALGWDGSGQGAYYELGLHYHSMGLAIDIQPSQNPYIFRGKEGQTDTADDWYESLIKIATNVYGGDQMSAKALGDWSKELSTEELYAKIDGTNGAISKYLELTKADTETFVTTLTSSKHHAYTESEARAIAGRRKGHWDKFHDAERKQSKAKSMTNLHEDMVIALRDVGGLAWGAGEFTAREGGVNGDFMHFDCRNDAVGGGMLSSILAPAP
jgi:hypothetical protein